MPTSSPSARLEARLSKEVHAMLKQAASIEGRTLSDFVVTAAQDAARRTIEGAQVLRLSAEDQRRFADALLHPAPLVPALERAIERHGRLIEPR